jgi:hypothetical protein
MRLEGLMEVVSNPGVVALRLLPQLCFSLELV